MPLMKTATFYGQGTEWLIEILVYFSQQCDWQVPSQSYPPKHHS